MDMVGGEKREGEMYAESNMLLLSRFSRVRLVRTHRWERQPTRLRHPWDSPGKNTGVGCQFLLQCMKVKSESEVAQSCPTLSDPVDCSLPGSAVHGIFQVRELESNKEIYNTICKNRQWEFAVCLRELKQGLYKRLKGGMGREMRGSSGREGTSVYLWLILVDV